MTTSNNNVSTVGLETRLTKAVNAARTRFILGFIVSVASIGAVQYWLNDAHDRFAAVTPEFVSQVATAKVLESIPAAGTEIKARLANDVPKVLDQAEAQLLNLPTKFSDELTAKLESEAGNLSQQTEENLYVALRGGLIEASKTIATHAAAEGKQTDAERMKAFAQTFGNLYQTESEKLVNRIHTKYKASGSEALEYLDLLATGKNLNPHQQLQRDALTTFLAAAYRKSNASTANAN